MHVASLTTDFYPTIVRSDRRCDQSAPFNRPASRRVASPRAFHGVRAPSKQPRREHRPSVVVHRRVQRRRSTRRNRFPNALHKASTHPHRQDTVESMQVSSRAIASPMRAHLERRLLRRRGRLGTASLDGGVDLLRLLRRLGRDADAGKAGGEHRYLFVCRNVAATAISRARVRALVCVW